MAQAQDILMKVPGSNDLLIVNGDLTVDLSDEYHIYDIMNDYQGFWKEFPLVGIGLAYYQNSTGYETYLSQQIKKQLTTDGYTVSGQVLSYDLSTSKITINPNAVRK